MKVFNCNKCSKIFQTARSLSVHQKNVHGPMKECPVCLKMFGARNLKVHMKTHENDKNFGCDFCASKFGEKSRLRLHMVIHRREKKFRCDKCNRGFNYSQSYKEHLLTHDDPRPFKCDVCPKAYINKLDLRIHKTTAHSNARKFACEICSKTFKTKASEIQHRKLVHGKFISWFKLTQSINELQFQL